MQFICQSPDKGQGSMTYLRRLQLKVGLFLILSLPTGEVVNFQPADAGALYQESACPAS